MSDLEARSSGGGSGNGPARGARPIWIVLAMLAIVGAFAVLVTLALRSPSPARSQKVYEYTIPPGTGQRIEAGEKLYVFPGRLDVRVGDQLVIHNTDTRVAEVGPYTVDRNATLVQRFNQPGTIVGICSIHPSGQVTITVRA